jgi:hypothetical protein
MFVKKITLGICTPVACVLLFRMNNTILTTSFRYHCDSKRQYICRCRRNSLSIFTSVLFIGEFLTQYNAKLSFLDSVGAHKTSISCTNMLSKCIK